MQKNQSLYSQKRATPTLVSHMGFGNRNTKIDKIFSGYINLFFQIFLLSGIVYNGLNWYNDTKPYISS